MLVQLPPPNNVEWLVVAAAYWLGVKVGFKRIDRLVLNREAESFGVCKEAESTVLVVINSWSLVRGLKVLVSRLILRSLELRHLLYYRLNPWPLLISTPHFTEFLTLQSRIQ